MKVDQKTSFLSAEDASRLTLLTSHQEQRPYAAAFLPVKSFPLDTEERARLRDAFESWTDSCTSPEMATVSFLEMNKLPLSKGAPLLSANGRRWLPSTGLGVFPDREPPRLWTEDDFFDRDYGTPLPPLMHTVFLMQGGEDASKHAIHTMFGSGALTYLVVDSTADEYVKTVSEKLLLPIQEESLMGFPFYVPLLSVASLQAADAEQIRQYLGSARLYVRESVEDGGILIISATSEAMERLLPVPA